MSPNPPSLGDEIEIEDARYSIINVVVMSTATGYYNDIKIECVPAGPAYPEFHYDAEKLINSIKDLFMKKKFAI